MAFDEKEFQPQYKLLPGKPAAPNFFYAETTGIK